MSDDLAGEHGRGAEGQEGAEENEPRLASQCPANPFWYDCDEMPCADCSERMCEGGCGQADADCCCDPDAEYPPAPGCDLGFELAKPEPGGERE